MNKLFNITLSTTLLIFNVELHAADASLYKGRWYTVPWDLTQSFDDNPSVWGRFETAENKWRKAYDMQPDGKASTLRAMVSNSPGCVLLNGKGDHKDVWSLKFENPKTKGWKPGLVTKLRKVSGFSDNKSGSHDGDRKSAYEQIWQNCGVIYGSEGKECVDIYGISLCLPF